MRILRCRNALSLLSVAIFAGCGGGQPTSGIAPSAGIKNAANSAPLHQRGNDTFVSIKAPKVRSDRHKSWVSPDTGRVRRLLFISDVVTNDVYIFIMPGLALKGTLTGFNEPQGMCSDAVGNIWITNTGTYQILEYSHTGRLLNTLSDPGNYYPVGCAIDPATGNLAVANLEGPNGLAGDILVYPGASGTPAVYTCPGLYRPYFLGYGPGGSLWVDGQNQSGIFALCGGGSPSGLSQIPLSGDTIYFPGLVQWDNAGSTWYVGDQYCGHTTAACIYPVSGSGVVGPAITLTNYSGGYVCELVQGVIGQSNKFVAGGDYNYCKNASPAVYRWPFPGGGSPSNFNNSAVTGPIGAAISKS